MKKMCVKNIKAGKTVYYVHALGENSFTIKYLVTGRPKTYRFEHVKSLSDSLFVPSRYVFRDGTIAKIESTFSLMDANVQQQNDYNKHRLFFSRKAANRYVELCKHHTINLVHSGDDADPFWDYRYD